MKLKILLRLLEKVFKLPGLSEGHRADMYLPERLFAMSLIFMCGGLACGVYTFFKFEVWAVVIAILGILLGVAALLCWRNQTIHIISDEQFTYTTMFGNSYTYNFSDIEGLLQNKDSMTLLVAGKRVHIESMAVLSNRLTKLINKALSPDKKYLKMSAEELSKLSDQELITAIIVRTEDIVSSVDNLSLGFNLLRKEQRIFYAVNYLEVEVNNGGLCQFFVNSSRLFAPDVSEYMEIIGAVEHKELYDTFVEKNQINVAVLSSFDSADLDAFQDQLDRYPFDDYDDAFYKLQPLESFLLPFIREHIEKF